MTRKCETCNGRGYEQDLDSYVTYDKYSGFRISGGDKCEDCNGTGRIEQEE